MGHNNLYIKGSSIGLTGSRYLKGFQSWTSNASFQFDGSNEYIHIPFNSDINMYTNYQTIVVWVKTTSPASIESIISKDTTGGVQRDWNLVWRGLSSGYRRPFWFGFHTDGAVSQVGGGSPAGLIDDGNWHQIIIVFNLTNIRLWIDGILRDTTPRSSAAPLRTNSISSSIGSLTGAAGWFFNGNIYDPYMFASDQSGNIASLWNGGVPQDLMPYYPNDYWKFENATWNGIRYVVNNEISNNNGLTTNMEIGDKVIDIP